MRWIVPIVLGSFVASASACGGADIPTHSGYKNDKSAPWKKAKVLSWNEKNELKAEDDLAYSEFRRARWYAVDLPRPGTLAFRFEITGPGDEINPEFDLGIEILDRGYRVLAKSDLEDEDASETTKTRSLPDLPAGRYYVHFYLQGRRDSAEYVMRATYTPAGTDLGQSDFPAHVAYLDPLPIVPTSDDTPKNLPKPTPVKVTGGGGPRTPRPSKPTDPPVVASNLTARVLSVGVSGGGTSITVGRGTESGVTDGMKARLKGITGAFPLSGCTARTCKATVSATPDQIKAAGSVVSISP